MLFLSLQNFPFSFESISSLKVQGIELRLDFWDAIDKYQISSLCQSTSLPLIFALRKASQGGHFTQSEEKRLNILEELLSLEPTFVDIEHDTNPLFVQHIAKEYPKTRIIFSYHNGQATPQDLQGILNRMLSPQAFAYKIATHAHSLLDSLRMMQCVKDNPHIRMSGICMGSMGRITRILGPIFGNFIDYAILREEAQTAPGQLTLEELESVYGYSSLNPSTAIYGLIGHPIEQSRSHIKHNAILQERQKNAVYVKMPLSSEELSAFLYQAKRLGFSGLSVTMPLKETLFSFLSQVDAQASQCKAVNTLLFSKKGLPMGFNTDGRGALDALETIERVEGKTLLLLGAGGAARAIAYEAKKRGAQLIILNRTLKRAQILAQELDCTSGDLQDFPALSYDIVINATPEPLPIPPDWLLPHKMAMDIKNTQEMTPFLCAAREKQNTLIYGYDMFLRQALAQLHIWGLD
ncbi:MAG TPA: shikimate dehydrogenase [Rhabdochlamydiaceae bacterium]